MEHDFEKQHQKGKLHAVERITLLMDPGSFVDTTFDSGATYDGVITGYGSVHGRKVYVVAQDFTYKGGTLGARHGDSIVATLKCAVDERCPIVQINDSGGARIQEGIEALYRYGEIFYYNTLASGYIPQISVIVGPCAGGAVYSPGITDFVFVVDTLSQMFVTGPNVVRSVTREEVSAEQLGGALLHAQMSGVAHFYHKDEISCFAEVRRLLGVLPQNNRHYALEGYDPAKAHLPKDMDGVDPGSFLPAEFNRGYDMKKVLAAVFDPNSFLEVQALFGLSVIVGFAALSGITVGVVASQPFALAGVLDCNSSDKAARFVRFCDAFNVPLLSFTDVPGYLPGLNQEQQGIIRHGAKLLYAFSEATVPRVNVIVRKAFGGAYIAMNSQSIGADRVYAWPTAQIAVMGAEGAVQILYAKEARGMDEAQKAAFFRQKTEQYEQEFGNYRVAQENGYIDGVIRPVETREVLLRALLSLKEKPQGPKVEKKHGNIPL